MGVCKSVTRDVQKQAEMQSLLISNEIAEAIADRTELLITKILEDACDACTADERKVVIDKDIKHVVQRRGLEILYPLFDD